MSAVLSLTQDNEITALGQFLLNVLPDGVGVFKSQVNRVPEPGMVDFVMMTPLMRERLETNITTYSDGHRTSGPEIRIDLQPTKFTVQLDIHGPASADNVQIITTLFRSSYAVDQFATSGFDVTPLYHSEPQQIPFIDGEQQYENRWTVDLYMQSNATTTVAQQFADQLDVSVIDVEATYPII